MNDNGDELAEVIEHALIQVSTWPGVGFLKAVSQVAASAVRRHQEGTLLPQMAEEEEEEEEEPHACTFVNALCPDDLCVLPYGHPFTRRHRHLTGTMYGSANTEYQDQIALLRNPGTAWPKNVHYLAPEGTSAEELIRLGCDLQAELIEKGVLDD